MLTVALPTYNNSNIIWLQIESLCRQKSAPDFELIVCEEYSDYFTGEDFLKEYSERLKEVGCKSIKYLSLSNWIPLGQKWMVIREHMNKESIGMCLFASDNYSPNDRLRKTYDALKNGHDWVQWRAGYFYNILSHEAGKFEINENIPALFMCISTKILKNINTDLFPKKSVDTWLFRQSNPQNVKNYELCENGVHTDGFNTISHHRRLLYSEENGGRGLFVQADSDEVFNIFPKDIQERLTKLRNEHTSAN